MTSDDEQPFDGERRPDEQEPFAAERRQDDSTTGDDSRETDAAMNADGSASEGSDGPTATDAGFAGNTATSEEAIVDSPPTEARPNSDEPIWSPPAADEATAASTAWDATAPESLPPQPAAPILPFEIPQPEPWQPSEDELDPTADAGWERAAEHELVAVRPEDVPAILAVHAAGPLDPATAREAIASRAAVPGTLPPVGGPRGWSSPGSNPAGTSTTAAPGSIAASSGAFAPPAGASGPNAGAAPAWPNGAASGSAAQPATNLIDFPQPAPEVALGPSERRWRRASRRLKTGLEAAARPVLLMALFALGVSLGWAGYVGTRPLPAAAPVATLAPGTTTDVPPQVQSLIAAMNADDQSQLKVIVPSDAYRLLAGALTQEGVKSIRGAKALWTYTSGADSATEILVSVTTSDGSNFTFNLVVHLHNGMITEFR